MDDPVPVTDNPKRCRMFIDEVGNADLKKSDDPNVRYLSLTAVVTRQNRDIDTIEPALNAFKAAIFERHHAEVILHRREIVRREGVFAALRDESLRQRFDADLLDLIRTLPYRVMTVTIDKKLHRDRYPKEPLDPYDYCLRALLERYVRWLMRHGFRGDVLIEPRFKKVDRSLKDSFRHTVETGTPHIPSAAFREHLLSSDIKFFAKSANIAGLQLADILAHPSQRAMRARRDGSTLEGDLGARIVEILEASKYFRNPKTGEISGWGTKWLP
ncbi:MAG: DUF3800 domain-containing protein [Azospirillaceae bacterium]